MVTLVHRMLADILGSTGIRGSALAGTPLGTPTHRAALQSPRRNAVTKCVLL